MFLTIASNLSYEIDFEAGRCSALRIMIPICEQIGDILGAFQLAVLFKTVDFKVISKVVLHYICSKEQTSLSSKVLAEKSHIRNLQCPHRSEKKSVTTKPFFSEII